MRGIDLAGGARLRAGRDGRKRDDRWRMRLLRWRESRADNVWTAVVTFRLNILSIPVGATLGEGSGATMSEDEDDLHMDFSSDNSGVDFNGGHDMTGFGPLLPTESERSLMERVRQELKIELKQGFKSRIEDVREEIMRKRRAGKLPGDTTTVLKNWWQQHCKWPYPTEDDKAKLVEETGLQLKQINNWFINQRKRNWHSNSHSLTSLKSKRKY
ncbi:hypothetical protein F2Q70_00001560 [Brassica cretica]|uniref:Homeobox domain-containing protein n=1 Tax=Brassica cretica TaxID=69181 RepID=A0A8S9IPI6_BRACR|nr:hypothetical protein F2Q70_00001560 [Brassica cretica]